MISYDSIIASPPLRFLVGRDRKLFTIHAALVVHHSKPLGELLSGSMPEAKEKCALLGDIDDDTFVRFSQYAYTGDYVAADPEILPESSAIATTHHALNDAGPYRDEDDGGEVPPPAIEFAERVAVHLEAVPPPLEPEYVDAVPDYVDFEPEPVPADDGWGSFRSSHSSKDKKKKKKTVNILEEPAEEAHPSDYISGKVARPERFTPQTKKSKLWDAFKSIAPATSGVDFQPRKNQEPRENYTEVFLCHARLYVFADKYDIGPLRSLSRHKLLRTLVAFTLYEERVGDIVDLLRYSYSNPADGGEHIEDLRLVVAHYAACEVENLAPSPGFQSLLEEAGPLARDLFAQMVKRLD